MNLKYLIKSRLSYPFQTVISKVNYWCKNYREFIWLIGDGRSGTTWVANLLNYDKKYRIMFEPFHPKISSFILPHQYLSPYDSNEQIEKRAYDVFTGKFRNIRVDQDNYSLIQKGLIIKDIYANLLTFWISLRFPNVKPILLIRNPFSVALSKSKKTMGFWANDPAYLVNQKSLYKDYLYPFKSLLDETKEKNDFILNQILIWSIIHYVPLCQFDEDKIHVSFYENIFENPDDEISQIFKFVRTSAESPNIVLDPNIVNKPSRVSGQDSNIVLSKSPIFSWKREIPQDKIAEGYRILKAFGLEELYGDDSLPNKSAIKKIKRIN